MPTSVGANRIAAHAEIFLTSSFWARAGFGEAAHLLVLPLPEQRRLDRERVLHQRPERIGPLHHPQRVIEDIARVALQLQLDLIFVETLLLEPAIIPTNRVAPR